MEIVTIYVTCANREQANLIAHQLVSQKLAACANILSETSSVYEWEGMIRQDTEIPLLLKTRFSLISKVTDEIKKLHSYDNPCVVVWPILGGNQEYLSWVLKETGTENS